MTTTANTIPKYNSSLAGSSSRTDRIAKAKKQRIAPIHKSMENPPNNCLQNLIHSGVVFGGDKAFGPSLSKLNLTFSAVRPVSTDVS